jgi:hypothetical protein
MQTKRINPNGVRVGLVISQAAKDTMFDNGYATDRTIGRFISRLIVEHHARVSRKLTKEEIAQELHTLARLLEDNSQVAPMPLANIIDDPDGWVGVTVISEEDGCKEEKAKPL